MTLPAALAAVLLGAQVEMRGGEPAPAGEVVRIAPEGVVFAESSGRQTIVGWDRVRRVGGEHRTEAEAFAVAADLAWRARTRLERLDFFAAEPLFEHLAEDYRGGSGPTSALVAEGLVRCRLRRGAHVAAIEPWTWWLRSLDARDRGPAWAEREATTPILDPVTGLVPALPPIWVPSPAVEALARSDAPVGTPAEDTGGQMDAWYRHAAAIASGLPGAPPRRSGHPGVSLVADVVLSQEPDRAGRAAARDRLRERLGSSPAPWVEAWCRSALGRSLLLEDDREAKQRGVIELLHVPARLGEAHAHLSAISLAFAAAALADLGDAAGAAELKRELRRRYDGHGVLSWDALSRIDERTPARAAPDSGSQTP
jgi:hypothetical protein